MNTIAERARAAGVVGAGGAGFPAYVKLASSVRNFIANGAECEPLLHKDKELMLAHGEEIVRGLAFAVEATGASRVFFAAKNRYPDSFNLMRQLTGDAGFEMLPLGNFYPSGDEYELVREATGRLIPPGGIPPDVDTVVNNVETLYNLARAMDGHPVVDTYVTVNGAVKKPGTFRAPVGCTLGDLVEAAGGATAERPAALFNGAMMGSVVTDLSSCVVTRTSTGAVIVPGDHALVRKKTRTAEQVSRIGKSACDQCSDCTALCPRYLLGYAVEPHMVMRSLGFTGSRSPVYDVYSLLCCECNICSLYACPEDLHPKEVCVAAKRALIESGRGSDFPASRRKVHAMKEHRRIPLDKLIRRLGLHRYDQPAPFREGGIRPQRVTIPLKQHTGEPALPAVKQGQTVSRGDVVGRAPGDKLGVPVHASISGAVAEATRESVIIES